MRELYYLIAVAGLATSGAAAAQSAAQPGGDSPAVASSSANRVFDPAFFARYRPVSALDMVRQVPGFRIESGQGLRGFGADAGNVLIDGARPSSKSDDIETILARIPASQVLRIELNEQAGSASDARGKAQTVNVVRRVGNTVSGTYTGNLEIGAKQGVTPYGDISVTVRNGATSVDLGLSHYSEFIRSYGPEYLRDGAGILQEYRQQFPATLNLQSTATAALHGKYGAVALNLNGKLERLHGHTLRDSDIFSPTGAYRGREVLLNRDPGEQIDYELGGDIEFPLTHSLSTKVIALYNNQRYRSTGHIETGDGPIGVSAYDTRTDAHSDEAILRLQNSWAVSAAHAVQFGGEVALNRLNQQLDARSSNGSATTQFPASDVNVREWRFEPFVSDVWSVAKGWKVELGLIAESSQLRVSDAGNTSRHLFYWKPRAVATWTVNPHTTIELRAERLVSQLDFDDFATSVDLSKGNHANVGNRDLKPETSWTFEAKVRHGFWDKGSVSLATSYVAVSDTQDLVPIEVRDAGGNLLERFDGPGNIGASKRWNIEFETNIPLDRLTRFVDIDGLQLNIIAHYHGSRVIDPVTGKPRERSGNPAFHETFALRHDLPSIGWAWGAKAEIKGHQCDYFFNQTSCFVSGAETSYWIEYKRFSLGTVTLTLDNLFNLRQNLLRTWYQDTRASGQVVATNLRQRSRDLRLVLTLSGKF